MLEDPVIERQSQIWNEQSLWFEDKIFTNEGMGVQSLTWTAMMKILKYNRS